jgi:hypothetical protein
LGPKAKDHYVVLSGLKEGEKVVVNGNFKLDSAIQILAKPSLLSIPGGHAATAHHHHGGSEVMDEEYQYERTKSRTTDAMEPEKEDHATIPQVATPEKTDKPHTERSLRPTIGRRKPGAYGDTTRAVPSASGQ